MIQLENVVVKITNFNGLTDITEIQSFQRSSLRDGLYGCNLQDLSIFFFFMVHAVRSQLSRPLGQN